MLSLVSTTGAVEVHSLGVTTVIFVSCLTQFEQSGGGRTQLPRGALLYFGQTQGEMTDLMFLKGILKIQ